MNKTTFLAFLALAGATVAQQGFTPRISMVFTDTDASLALMAISMRTGANIVYANKTKTTITLKLSVNTAEEAVRSVTASAGLAYKKVGTVYVVASPTGMRDALAPYTHTTTYAVEPGTADAIAQRIQAAMPYVTAQANGDRVLLTAINEDVPDAIAIVRSYHAPAVQRTVREVIMMHNAAAEEIAPLLKGLYPTLIVSNTLSKNTENANNAGAGAGAGAAAGGAAQTGVNPSRWLPVSHGAIGLSGPEDIVAEAKKTIEMLDSGSESDVTEHVVYDVYNLKYLSAPSAVDFLKKAAPEIDAVYGPEQISPLRANFNPMSTQIAQSQTSSVGGGSSGGGGGGGSNSGGGGGSQGAAGGGSSATGSTSGASGLKPGERAKSIVLKGKRTDVDRALKMISDLDIKPRQCVVEVNVLETSPTDAEQLGLGYTFSPISFYQVPPGTALASLSGGGYQLGAAATRPVGVGQVSMSPMNFQTILSALVSHQKAKILAKPSLQVIDNDQASVFIGNTISVELTSTGNLGGTSQSIASFPVGIILLVSPKISPDGTVTMHVNPVISSVSSIDANGIPQTAAREADTTVILKDGETMVLGGLIQDQERTTVTAVPYLSQLPIVGQLFRSRNYSRSREDIVVSITTHIVKDTKPEGS
ncbi:MAG: type II and III secretion system protein [Fimbriimonas sp.]|nr:type II and III secretion system protein [Fimbriimonas sp.]